MAGHSKHNGDQVRLVLRDLERLARDQREMKRILRFAQDDIQARTDRAVALADREIGVRSQVSGVSGNLEPPPFSSTAVPAVRTGGTPVLQTRPPLGAPYALHYGASAPVPELETRDLRRETRGQTSSLQPPASSAEDISARLAAGWTWVFGASGNPLTGGFLVDLGEYNPQMMGLNAVRIYEQMRRGDGQVFGILQAMMLPVKSARWELVPDEGLGVRGSGLGKRSTNPQSPNPNPVSTSGAGRNTASKAQEVCAFVKANLFGGLEARTPRGGWATQSFTDVLNIALRMVVFGCAVYEMIFTVDGDKLRLRRCADRQALTFYRWHTDPAILDPSLPLGLYDDGETLVALQQYGYRGGTFVTPLLPADKIARFTYNQEGANFWGLPPTRAMYPHWYVKNALQRIDAIACERNSLGVPSILLPPGASKEDVAAAQQFVTALAAHERTGLTLPSGAEFKIVGVEGRLRDILPSIEYQDMQMARAGLAMFMQLGESSRSGSRALGQEQTDFFMLALQVTADQIASVIRNETIRPLVEMNFGAGAPVPVLKAANVQARTLEDTVDAIARLAQAGAWTSDRDSLNRLRHELGFGDLEEEEGSRE